MAACPSAATIKFTVRRRPAVLVAPASPTPRELKRLSDFDNHENLRFQIPGILFYQRNESMSMAGKDPALVIQDAVARALVPYYPFAGRLREHEGGKLAVDCTAEGVLFVEADADVRLEQFGDALLPPFPCVEELLFDVPGSSAILDTPLLLFQVTRLACGGFAMAVRLNHTMADALGLTQFLGAVAELARGDAMAPTVRPVWERHLLEGRRNNPPPPPPPQRQSHELDFFCYPDEVTTHGGNKDNGSGIMLASSFMDDMELRSFFFGPGEIAAIRAQLSSSPDLQKRASRFDVIAGWLWKCRTMALAPPDSNKPMPMIIVVNARGRGATGSGIPTGYYGNAFAVPVAISTAGELCTNPVSYAVGLVKEAKDKVDMEYMRSVADLVVHRRGQVPRVSAAGLYCLSDETKARFDDFNFGWGKPVYVGPAEPVINPAVPLASSFILPFKNANGEDGAVVPVCLPRPAMDRLVDEMGKVRRWRSPDDVATLQQQPRHGFPFPAAKRSAL